MDDSDSSLFEVLLKFSQERDKMGKIIDSELNKQQMMQTQKIQEFQDKHRTNLIELRNCIEYINRHAQMIQSALRGSDSSPESAMVIVCHSTITEIIALRDSIQQSLTNAIQIRQIVGASHQRFVDGLIEKMEKALINWTELLKIATRNLSNSTALMENMQNLVAGQQQMCADVTSSDLFQSLNADNEINDKEKCSTPSSVRIG